MALASDDSLIGRARELERLRRYVDSVADGATAALLIEGEAGIGKTRLLMSLIETPRASGLAVFHGEAHPLERTRPFGALVEALDLLSGSNDPRPWGERGDLGCRASRFAAPARPPPARLSARPDGGGCGARRC